MTLIVTFLSSHHDCDLFLIFIDSLDIMNEHFLRAHHLISCSSIHSLRSTIASIMTKDQTRRSLSVLSSGPRDSINWNLLRNKLYDRENQRKDLHDAYLRSRRPSPPELVIVTGVSGSGKTALANSLRTTVENDHGLFISGKSDDQIDTPHGPFVAAVEELVEQLLSCKTSEAAQVRESALEAVGADQFLLTKAIPCLRPFFHPDPSQRKLLEDGSGSSSKVLFDFDNSSSELDNNFGMEVSMNDNPGRFTNVFCRFFRAVAAKIPLVILIDDLQWLDPQSLDLLSALFHPSIKTSENLMILGTCRGNEVSVYDRLAVLLRKMEEQGLIITDIQVQNLTVKALNGLLSDALELQDAHSLAEVVHSQTGGNVFFAKQYLLRLMEDEILYRDDEKQWTWDDETLQDEAIQPNGADGDAIIPLLVRRLQQFPEDVVEILKTMACMGTTFDENILYHAGSVVSSQVLLTLEVADAQGFIEHDFDTGKGKFLHDKFREASLSLIPAEEKARYQLTLGRNFTHRRSNQKQLGFSHGRRRTR
jgi:predicted ATPase